MNSQSRRRKFRSSVVAGGVLSLMGVVGACGGRFQRDDGADDPAAPTTDRSSATAGAPSVAGASNVAGASSVVGTAGSPSDVPPSRPRVTPTCTSPEKIQHGTDTGFVACKEGYVHRPRAVACAYRPREGSRVLPGTGPGPKDECERDSDCPGERAYCEQADDYEFHVRYLACRNGCETDADCLERQICRCGEVTGTCELADCETDASCGPGQFCVGTDSLPGCGSETFACSRPEDECTSNTQCTDPKKPICYEGGKGISSKEFRHCDQQIYCD